MNSGPYSRLARPSGAFAILANDARETLRSILVSANKKADDDSIRAAKVAIARALSPHASAILVDRVYGLAAILGADALAASCGLIVSSDTLIQPVGKAVQDTLLDLEIMNDKVVQQGAVAFKFLVIWEPGRVDNARRDMVAQFVERCRGLGVLSVLEGVVRMPAPRTDQATDDIDAVILQTARDLGAFAPDLYKGQVPTLGRGTAEDIERLSREVTSAVRCPWVVLSGGVAHDRFPMAVEAACRGGASGFLAGRGVWGPSLGEERIDEALRVDATARLQELISIVDRHARPWFEIPGLVVPVRP
jgi:sulfofructosephosphate aldolase